LYDTQADAILLRLYAVQTESSGQMGS